jgi:hypothetical protein
MNPVEPRSGSIHFWTSCSSTYRITARWRIALSSRAKVRTDKLQPVIRAAWLVAERGCGP